MRAKKGYLTAFRQSIERHDVTAGRRPAERGRPADRRNAGRGAGRPGRAARALRDRHARVARQAQPGHAAAALPRVAARAQPGAAGARRRAARDRRALAAARASGCSPTPTATCAWPPCGRWPTSSEAPVADLVRPYLGEADPRLASSAAMVLARSGAPPTLEAAEATLARLAGSHRAGRPARRRGRASAGRRRRGSITLLIPLLYDDDPEVAEEALRSVRALGTANFLFVPTLVSLLRNRRLKGAAREVLVGYGADVVPALAHFLRDARGGHLGAAAHPGDAGAHPVAARPWTRWSPRWATSRTASCASSCSRPSTRCTASGRTLTFDRKPIEDLVLRQATTYFTWLSPAPQPVRCADSCRPTSLLAQALREKTERAVDRIYRCSAIALPVAGHRRGAMGHRARRRARRARARSSTSTTCSRAPCASACCRVLEDMPLDEKVARGNALLSTRARGHRGDAAAADQRRRPGDGRGRHRLRGASSSSGRSPPTSSTCSRTATRATGSCSRRRRGRWPSSACPKSSVRQLWLRAAAGRRSSRPPAHAAGVRRRVGRRAVPHRGSGPAGALRAGTRARAPRGSRPTACSSCSTARSRRARAAARPRSCVRSRPWDSTRSSRAAPRRAPSARRPAPSVCRLTVEECRTLLAENADLVQGLFRTVLEHPAFEAERFVIEGRLRRAAECRRLSAEGVTPIEKVLALQKATPFARCGRRAAPPRQRHRPRDVRGRPDGDGRGRGGRARRDPGRRAAPDGRRGRPDRGRRRRRRGPARSAGRGRARPQGRRCSRRRPAARGSRGR